MNNNESEELESVKRTLEQHVPHAGKELEGLE